MLLDAGATGEPWVRMIAARPIPSHSCAAVFFLNVISTILYEYMKPTLLNPEMVYSACYKARVQQGEAKQRRSQGPKGKR